VQALRAQVDRNHYKRVMRSVLEAHNNISIVQGMVEKLLIKEGVIRGVTTNLGLEYDARAVILTTGTFMKGLIHIGLNNFPGGRAGDFPSLGLSAELERIGLKLGRLKTGTPPRLNARSIDFSMMAEQKGDDPIIPFSYITEKVERPQVSCYLTYTSPVTHEIIRGNLDKSPLYGGVIKGIGPRYCPSIEDKVMRFSHKEKHQVFLEPEGFDTVEIYANGISTSLPAFVQLDIVRSIKGLENAEIMRPGYAIEYDFVPPTQLKPTLETKLIAGLYNAGQINGTSGYEEAAAQGLMAGINAALKVQSKGPFILDRSEAYIGVLIDDLITKGTEEPYRMFTSRAEYRLLLRHDNADSRLTEQGHNIGLISQERLELFREKRILVENEIARLRKARVGKVREGLFSNETTPIKTGQILPDTTLSHLLQRPEINYSVIEKISPPEQSISGEIKKSVEIEVKYDGYIKRQLELVCKFKDMENKYIPPDFDYTSIRGLSREVVEKLNKIKPVSLGHASRISGITPAAVAIIAITLAKKAREKKFHVEQ
ncbi:MAG: tRNA uridine-5-carboxymethylaminomethyl(34) synthesis enzyme MnmG, partial [Nitrospira sp.]|nr:tRNA uridine-5-carboxymethylaminomethyl(34) synthesis enzyme MnmG [Nitrospira sp.]